MLLARRLAADPRSPFRRNADEVVLRAAHFLRQRSAIADPVDLFQFAEAYPDLFNAVELGEEQSPQKNSFGIKVLALARATPEAIAACTGGSVTTIRLFEQLFFDVRDRLDQPSYIVHHAICMYDDNSSREERRRKNIMHVAYVRGEAVAKEFLYNCLAPQRRPSTQSEALEWLKSESDALLKREAYLAMMDLSVEDSREFEHLQKMNERDANLQVLDEQAEADRRKFDEGAQKFSDIASAGFRGQPYPPVPPIGK